MVERAQVKAPRGFDQTKQTHIEAVMAGVEKKYGKGWDFSLLDQAQGVIHIERRATVSSAPTTMRADGNTKALSLGDGYGPSDGEKAAARFEALPGNEGFVMTKYDPYGGVAELTKLSANEVRCRSAIAFALGVKAWEVAVRSVRGGGFDVALPAGYSPAKHDAKLEEVATTVVGKPGWYLDIDVPKLKMRIVPAEPATFPGGIPYPIKDIGKVNSVGRILFGQGLGKNGNEPGPALSLEFNDGPHTMLQGTSGSGKSVSINALIAGALAAGMELAIGDVPAKAVDFTWVRDYVRPGGWGCESLEENLAMLDNIYREGQRRARIFKEHDVQKISELPADVRAGMPNIFVVQDELAGILRKVNIPKSLDKEHPARIKAEQEAVVRDLTLDRLLRISAELRFVGVYGLFATQLASVNTGVPTELRANSSNRLLMGVAASENQRRLALNSPELAPNIPDSVRNNQSAARGVGVAELPGQGTHIFKGLYSSTEDFLVAIQKLGVKKTPFAIARPTSDEVARALGEDVMDQDYSGPPLANDPDVGALDANGNPLKGAAAAAHASKKYAG